MAGISFGGLASGLDSQSIIAQLMSIERQPRVRLDQQETKIKARQSALNEVLGQLKNLGSTAAALRSASLYANVQSVESSDPSHVAVSRTAMAGAGGHTLSVSQLARAEQRTYDFTQNAGATQLVVNGTAIDLAANADLATVVDTVNSTASAPVYAAAVDGKLVLSSRTTGASGGFTVSGSATVAEVSSLAGLDAQYTLDGVAGTSASNVLQTAIPGLTVTLKGVTASPASISIGAPAPDPDRVKDAVKAFVTAYNDTISSIQAKLKEKPVANPANDVDRRKGVLFGDSGLSSLLGQLRGAIADPVAGNPAALDQLAELGITTGAPVTGTTINADAVAGKLVLDEAKLADAVASNPMGVRQLLGATTGADGFSQRFTGLLDPFTGAGGTIDSRVDSGDAQLKSLHDAMADMDARLKLKEARLKAQFTALETAMSKSQSQGQWLAGQLASL